MTTFYEKAGGELFFSDLVSRFYANVAVDPILRPMYPDTDMKAAARRLQLFLEQYWGGPTTYSDERGHPRLRMRHGGFHIDGAARDAWIACMKNAVDGMEIDPEIKVELWKYLQSAAIHLVNQPD
ncbi:MAG: globin [Actinomycetes bacterium]